MTTKLLSVYGMKYNPFRADIPAEALYVPTPVDAFLRRVENGLADGEPEHERSWMSARPWARTALQIAAPPPGT